MTCRVSRRRAPAGARSSRRTGRCRGRAGAVSAHLGREDLVAQALGGGLRPGGGPSAARSKHQVRAPHRMPAHARTTPHWPASQVPHRGDLLTVVNPCGLVALVEFHCSAVEFVADRTLTRRVDRRVGDSYRIAIAQREVVGEPRRSRQHAAHRVPVEIRHQIGQPGTFGVHWRAGRGQCPDLFARSIISG